MINIKTLLAILALMCVICKSKIVRLTRCIVATQASAQEVSSLREALAQDPTVVPEIKINTLPTTDPTNLN